MLAAFQYRHQQLILEEYLTTLMRILVVRFQEYFAAKKKISSANELLNLAVEVRETAKGQLISGRSSIQDVMNAEVTLAETEIGLVNAKADAAILSYKIFALTDSLSTYIGWFE